MIDVGRLRDILVDYKRDFAENRWESEKYKWEAVKEFLDNWDVGAEDFSDMLNRSLEKTSNLLASVNNFPRRMIERFAERAPEEVRAMFIDLYDESKDLYERIRAFKNQAAVMLEKYGNGATQDYQHENAISVYLWLRYPDKYYIYKYNEVKTVAKELGSGYSFKRGAYAENIGNSRKLYDEICRELKNDRELEDLLRSRLTDTCYPDPELRTLTVDVGFYISRIYSQGTGGDIPAVSDEWFPRDYEPGLTADDWAALLRDRDVFTKSALEIVCRMKDCGGQATCTELAERYGGTKNFYRSGSVALARRVANKTGCPLAERTNGNTRWWSVLYVGKKAGRDEEGSYIWKLRDELSEALEGIDSSQVRIHTQSTEPIETYTKDDFLDEVYMSEERYERLVALLKNKQNIILQGAPGVGKTFAAKRLAYSMMGEKDESRIEFVQFHQSYSYEDFVMGYKPVEDGFELKRGIFHVFCQKAAARPNEEFFFIIDEINRGNLSKIFGELLMLIEKDYRGTETTLAYDGQPFSVPKNLYIIGMMNTADRSLAMIDYALRRRFGFFEMEPGFDSEGFIRYQNSLSDETFDELIEKVKDLNREIASDKSLGKGFCIGHSYFCGRDVSTEDWLRSVVDFDILPMLSEYWFDDEAKLRRWDNILHGVFQ